MFIPRRDDFPEELKLAKVLLIYKNDDEQLIQNYRPISVLPFYNKLTVNVKNTTLHGVSPCED